MQEVLEILKEAFDHTTVDIELWDELDDMDDGERVNVPMTVMDLKKIRDLLMQKI